MISIPYYCEQMRPQVLDYRLDRQRENRKFESLNCLYNDLSLNFIELFHFTGMTTL